MGAWVIRRLPAETHRARRTSACVSRRLPAKARRARAAARRRAA